MAGPANNAIVYWEPGKAVTGKAIGAAVTGCRFVKVVSGGVAPNPGIATAGADVRVFGVAQNDCAQNDTVGVRRGGAVSVKAAASITGGSVVFSDASGQATTTGTNNPAGICLADTASGALAPIMLF